MLRDDEPLTPVEELALREVLAGLRHINQVSGHGLITLPVRESEPERVCVETSKRLRPRN